MCVNFRNLKAILTMQRHIGMLFKFSKLLVGLGTYQAYTKRHTWCTFCKAINSGITSSVATGGQTGQLAPPPNLHPGTL